VGNPSVRRAGKVCRHHRCRRIFRPTSNYQRQVYCGRTCAALDRPRASRVAAGRKGGQARAEHFWRIRLDAIRARVVGLGPFDAWRDGVLWARQRYAAKAQSDRRAQFSAGYEAALRDMGVAHQDIRRSA
jgi:hypothetical protein